MNIALTVVLLADIFFRLVKSDKANYTEDTKPILVTWITEDLHSKLNEPFTERIYRDDVLEAVAKGMFDKLMIKIRNGGFTLGSGITVGDPMIIPQDFFISKLSSLANVEAEFSHLGVSGLRTTRLTFLRVLRNRFLRDMRLVGRICMDIRVFGHYSLSGQGLGFIPLKGEGGFRVEVDHFCLASITYITKNSTEDANTLTFRELDSGITVHKFQAKFENLMGGGLAGTIANDLIDTLDYPIMKFIKAEIIRDLRFAFHKYLAQLF